MIGHEEGRERLVAPALSPLSEPEQDCSEIAVVLGAGLREWIGDVGSAVY